MNEHLKPAESSNVVELPPRRGPGERLRAARTAAGLTIEGVADDLHISRRLLEAIERDDYTKLPGRVFARGYLRNYARLVELPVDQVLESFDALAPPAEEAAPALRTVVSAHQIRSQVPSSHSAVRAVTWIIVLALVALLLTWWQGYLEWPGLAGMSGKPQAEAPVILLPVGEPVPAVIERDIAAEPEPPAAPAAATPDPAAKGVETPTAATAAPGREASAQSVPDTQTAAPVAKAPDAAIELTGRSWLEVLDSSGAFKLSGTFGPGFRKTLEGEPPYRIAIGNYKAARVLVGETAVDLLPHFDGRIVRFTLDPREPLPQ